MIDKIRVRTGRVIQDVWKSKKLFFGIEERIAAPGELYPAIAEILADPESIKCRFEDVGIEAVVVERLEQVDDMCHLARIDNTQAIEIPLDLVADFLNPPIHIFAESDDAPIKFR